MVCTWESLQGSFIGTNAREEWSLQTQAEIAGLSNPRGRGHKTTGQMLQEWSGPLLLLGCVALSIFLLASDDSEETTIRTVTNPAVSTPVPERNQPPSDTGDTAAPTAIPHNPQPWNPPVTVAPTDVPVEEDTDNAIPATLGTDEASPEVDEEEGTASDSGGDAASGNGGAEQ